MPLPEAAFRFVEDGQSGLTIAVGWLSGVLVLGVFITFALHFADVAIFLSIVKGAAPIWLGAAAVCQCGTYAFAAAVWFRVLCRADVKQPFLGLFRLAVVQLFANQALPSGGLSGAAIVARGLLRRRVSPSLVTTAILVDSFTYYSSYLLVALVAFAIVSSSGELAAAWLRLTAAFIAALLIFLGAAFLLIRRQSRIIPNAALSWAPAAKLSAILRSARTDLLRDVELVSEGICLQTGIFLLDAASLWIAARSVGIDVDFVAAFSAFVLASVVATLSPVPLGLGTFEGTCTALLHIMGSSIEGSLAATLIFRGFTLWLPMLPGILLIRKETNTPIDSVAESDDRGPSP
ncbi:flippase-like domain-containing protein (plasmid) [Ensifer sp. PDNC004]|uniref:lysylphosphatidylglycerol synthase transmembrane domain-containing protein n=1 Tax=Ensifer sp. PDNC004 TaxID=2811423 RepID=UPI001963482D|nr:lysylphosphatidylglycerol synthase transmembrane domain-containing protein [Ensifer sp. PDNC004]QRY70488.1 flippase-like domain-containing protein [Ensifer sp. PDNC004]